jgi:hypothetical protein
MSGELCGLVSPVSRMRQVEDATMRVMTANLTRTKTEGNRYPVDTLAPRLRGLLNVASEWKLICATHNLLKLFRYRIALAPA